MELKGSFLPATSGGGGQKRRNYFEAGTQGSSFVATLGWMLQLRWSWGGAQGWHRALKVQIADSAIWCSIPFAEKFQDVLRLRVIKSALISDIPEKHGRQKKVVLGDFK